ncbi:MAG TPA: ABC transporter permease [Phycisphaerae bacterium]|nr:ABC transporter permease [Phycisphaerae bacterium]
MSANSIPPYSRRLLEPFATIGQTVTNSLQAIGDFGAFFGAIIFWIFRGPSRTTLREMLVQMYETGTLSIPVVMITGGFIGAVLAIEAFSQFAVIPGLADRLGAVIMISVVKQIGPILTAVMLAGRVGGAMTAELGTMRVTEQIDALRAMGADPIRTLVTPRVLACVIMTPVLTIYSDLIGILGGWMICVGVYHIRNYAFWHYAFTGTDMFTVAVGSIKSFVFGIVIGSIACYKGFNCGNGAQGVGRACTESFVESFCVILLANFTLAVMLNNIYTMFWPNQPSIL